MKTLKIGKKDLDKEGKYVGDEKLNDRANPFGGSIVLSGSLTRQGVGTRRASTARIFASVSAVN